ncbi:unnamed protein product [Albugo candida]|uniref:Uncharacterized protein n=1 Tax=Albugo candida TaxID=65357 RepID=A0A024GCK6_9STRA|nr:unnamed protein product [Albugo candida]|eukprot:CCI44386.1 unnamed protein product [Albugo candida]
MIESTFFSIEGNAMDEALSFFESSRCPPLQPAHKEPSHGTTTDSDKYCIAITIKMMVKETFCFSIDSRQIGSCEKSGRSADYLFPVSGNSLLDVDFPLGTLLSPITYALR